MALPKTISWEEMVQQTAATLEISPRQARRKLMRAVRKGELLGYVRADDGAFVPVPGSAVKDGRARIP